MFEETLANVILKNIYVEWIITIVTVKTSTAYHTIF